jgi:actin-related protein
MGATVVSTLSAFKNMWITKADYTEKGDRELFTKTI